MWRDIVVAISRLLVLPYREWKNIGSKEQTEVGYLNRFLYPVFGMIALTTLVGGLWLTPDGNLQSALTGTVIQVVAVFGGYYFVAYLLNEMAPRFSLEKSTFRFQQFTGYSSVVLYLLFFVMPLLSGFNYLWLAAIYTVYIAYAGADVFLRVPENKRISFTVIASLLIVSVPLIMKTLLESIMNLLHN